MPGSRKVWSLFLLLLAAVCPLVRAQDPATAIALKSRLIDTSRPQPVLPEALRAKASQEDEIVLVKFPGPVTARQVKALRAASVRIYTYLPYYSYLVKMPAGGSPKALLSKLGASWTGPYHPAYKISPEIAAVSPEAKAGQGYRPVMIQVLPDADLSEVVRTMKDLGAKGIVGAKRNPFFSRVRLLLNAAEIAALREPLAGMRDVFWIEARRAQDAAQRYHRLGGAVRPLRRADDAHLQPGDLRRGADGGHHRYRHRSRHVLLPRHRPGPAADEPVQRRHRGGHGPAQDRGGGLPRHLRMQRRHLRQ